MHIANVVAPAVGIALGAAVGGLVRSEAVGRHETPVDAKFQTGILTCAVGSFACLAAAKIVNSGIGVKLGPVGLALAGVGFVGTAAVTSHAFGTQGTQ